MDFRECKLKSEWAGSFDKFISVEMIEHVGKQFFTEYWAVADWALKPDTGVGVVQGITIPDSRTTIMFSLFVQPVSDVGARGGVIRCQRRLCTKMGE
jgi:cyclopropane fatty-acyl-phospholipid synthase-like methyltransferase